MGEKVSQHLAANLSDLRRKKKLSQDLLAQASGIPRSTLAHFESGSGNPSLHNLVKLSEALQVGIEELLAKPRNEVELIASEMVPQESRSRGKVILRKFLPDRLAGLMCDGMEFEPNSLMVGQPHLSGAKEYLILLSGELDVYVAGEAYPLTKGCVLAFPGDQAHSYRNHAARPASALSIVVPISFRS